MDTLLINMATIVGGFGVHVLANPKIRTIGGDGSRMPEIVGPVVGVLSTLPFIIWIDSHRADESRYGWVVSYFWGYVMFAVGVLLAYFYQETTEG